MKPTDKYENYPNIGNKNIFEKLLYKNAPVLKKPIMMPLGIAKYLKYLDTYDLRLLIMLYRDYSMIHNEGYIVNLSPELFMKYMDCDPHTLMLALNNLENLELAMLLEKSSYIWRIRIGPVKLPRYLPDFKSPPLLNSYERKILQARHKHA